MARLNVPRNVAPVKTHEGGRASRISSEMELKRTVLCCLLWENNFYENGEDVASRIKDLIPKCRPEFVRDLAIEARYTMKLRHVPLLIAREMVRHNESKPLVSDLLTRIIRRPDECGELLSIYWKEDKTKSAPLANQIKKGIAKAFNKFDAYQLQKYTGAARMKSDINPRAVMFICHPKPEDYDKFDFTVHNRTSKRAKFMGDKARRHTDGKGLLWNQMINGTLPKADTWEHDDTKDGWESRLREGKVPAMAFIQNLRNMVKKNVDESLILKGFKDIDMHWALPFRFITAARILPRFEPQLEDALFKCLSTKDKFMGTTVLLVDVSGSMNYKLSDKSEVDRMDAACGLGILLREQCENVRTFSFSDDVKEVPSRRGFALAEAIKNSQPHGGTYLAKAIKDINKKVKYDRLIIVTDEQSHDGYSDPLPGTNSYIINVGTYKKGVGYEQSVHISGWSDSILDYISAYEKEFSK